MNVLLIGSGGREHAIAWKLSQSKNLTQLYAMPGNQGMSEVCELVGESPSNFQIVLNFCKTKNVELVIVGPEQPLVEGLSDFLIENGVKVFGPIKKGAMLEGSKKFSKDFMLKHEIPTAKYKTFMASTDAKADLDNWNYPLVIKASGLAAGKGVVICENRQEAEKCIEDLMDHRIFGSASDTILIEEFLQGKEASLIALIDGENFKLLSASRDHKALNEGNKGPNTGGMGAYSPVADLSDEIIEQVKKEVFEKVLQGLKKDEINYCGFLYAGLMLTKDGIKVLEFNARCGDPETQVILPLLKNDLLDLVLACCDKKLAEHNVEILPKACITVTLASAGYPKSSSKGDIIDGLQNFDDSKLENNQTKIFHGGTKLEDENWQTNGGRVLYVTTMSDNLESARAQVYQDIEKIKFTGMQYRKDIAED